MITLLGYMGSGKSTIGRKLASSLEFEFIDLDAEIENEIGRSISDIFAFYGDYFFRKVEHLLLKKYLLNHNRNIVLSTGGGACTYYNSIKLINEKSTSFYLKVEPSEIIQRIENQINQRPLLAKKSKSELKQFIEHQLLERSLIYESAENTIENKNQEETLNKIIHLYSKA